jgi:hypothetical protein
MTGRFRLAIVVCAGFRLRIIFGTIIVIKGWDGTAQATSLLLITLGDKIRGDWMREHV